MREMAVAREQQDSSAARTAQTAGGEQPATRAFNNLTLFELGNSCAALSVNSRSAPATSQFPADFTVFLHDRSGVATAWCIPLSNGRASLRDNCAGFSKAKRSFPAIFLSLARIGRRAIPAFPLRH
jgi:hypothetical protein